jgi:membrane-associated HD superfamily phosphohydrolase
VHEQISPSLSTVIITSHVKDGVELGREYGLPSVVRDIIGQHHGTSLVQYFYHQASTAPGGEDVPEERFRYAGPKPRTKEAAIVMLADAAFGAVWALPDKTPERVEATVRQIIRSRLVDEQLNECPLTLDDIRRITDSFLRMLKGMLFHMRIEYPGMPTGKEGDDDQSHERPPAEARPEVAQAGRDRGPEV